MTLFSSSLTNAEKHLLYLAKDQESSSKSPVDIEVKLNAKKANQSVFSNVLQSTCEGAFVATVLGVGFSALSPLFPTSVRATILGATYKKVCDASAQNLKNIADVFTAIKTSFVEANTSIVDFIDSFGIPCKELPFTGEDSRVGGWIRGIEQYFIDWHTMLEKDIPIWIASTVEQDAKTVKEEASSVLIGPRMINYMGSAIDMAKSMLTLIQTHTYGYYVAGTFVGGLALWSFAKNFQSKQPAEKRALDCLRFNFDKMLETLKELKTRTNGSSSAIMKEELKNLASSILENESDIYSELSALKLPKLDYEKQKELLKALMEEAKEIEKASQSSRS